MYRYLKTGFLLSLICVMGIAGCGKKAPQSPASGTASAGPNYPAPKPGEPTPIRIAFWGAVEEKEIIQKTVDAWLINHKDIKIILEHIPSGSYIDKVLTEFAGGNPPDIIFCEVNVFVTFFYKNALLDLTPFLQEDKELNMNSYFPEVVSRFSKNGRIFCIPRDTAPFACIFYNKSIFDKLNVAYPTDNWDMDQMLATAKKLTVDENGKTPGQQGFDPKKIKRYGFWAWAWQNFVYSFGGKLVDNIDNPTRCLLDEQAAVDGVQYFIDLSYKHNVSPKPEALTNTGMNINQLFVTEKLAMFSTGIWDTPNLRKTVGDKFKWDVVMFPKGPQGKRGFGTGGSGYAILNTTRFPRESWEVLKCLAGAKGQEMLADAGLAQPANRTIAEGEYWARSTKSPLNKKMLNEAVKYAVYDPFNPLWKEISDKYVAPQMDLIITNKVPVQEGLKKIAYQVNNALRGRR